MQAAFRAWSQELELEAPPRLKVGLHVGPALVVHCPANGLDYFGGSVNLAARTEGVARGGEIVWTQAVQDDPRVVSLITETGQTVEPLQRALKGLKEPISLYRIGL